MLPDFAKSLYQSFEREGIPLLLAGGWAVCHHGYSRHTMDIDWVCPRTREDEATALMISLHFEKRSDGMASRFKHIKDLTMPFVDLIWVDERSFQTMAQAEIVSSDPNAVPVINFRALLAMKLFALKDGESRDFKDLLDIRSLLRYNKNRISDEELKAMCLRYAGPDAYHQITTQK